MRLLIGKGPLRRAIAALRPLLPSATSHVLPFQGKARLFAFAVDLSGDGGGSCYNQSSMKRRVIARKTTLDRLDDSFDREFWAAIPPDQRLAAVWEVSKAAWELKGDLPGERGRPRSVARVLRP